MKWILAFLLLPAIAAKDPQSISVYQQKPEDQHALYFTPEAFNIKADGKMDVSVQLQAAINRIETETGYGILFIPGGKYLVSKTIYVPGSIRLIGYGKNRPEIILAKNSPGFQSASKDSPSEKYLIFFTGGLVTEGKPAGDAGAGTFYSAISNIDLKIEDGNPIAVAMRTHYAQHGFFSHMVINAGKAYACVSEVGNEIEDVVFIGGDYGITANQTSPSWPVAMIDTYFEGQRKAAIRSNNTGFAIVNMHVKDVPVAVEIKEGEIDRLFMENCILENVSKAGIVISMEDHVQTQVNVIGISCRNVPVFASYRQSGRKVQVAHKMYRVNEFVYGLVMEDMSTDSEIREISSIDPLLKFPEGLEKDIPALPGMEEWVNIRELGAKGDGETDDTKIFRDAVSKHKVIFMPQGFYRITGTIKLNKGTRLIGLHPWGTQFVLNESEPAFSGFGAPVPMIESSEGGDDILNGIGISTGGYNYRAVACKWMAGEKSYMNDIKFVGGHGTLRPVRDQQASQNRQPGGGSGQRNISSPSNPVYAQGPDLAWDNQFWSLWVTNGGGGTFKDLWTANTYATSGLYVSNTSTPSRVYAISLEHHVRNEARFENVSNWKLYAFQLEEESREGKDCQSVELSNCRNISFNNLWIYRVIRVTTPKRYGVRIFNCEDVQFRNIKNYTQKLVVTEFPIYDVNRQLAVFPWELAKVTVTGSEKANKTISLAIGKPEKLAADFYFPTGITSDSKGNVYFCETLRKRIYKWSAETNSLTILTDYPFQPFALATDTKDNLIVTSRYDPQPGYIVNGRQEMVRRLPDDNPGYSSWGNSGWATLAYSIDPDNPDETFMTLPRMASNQIRNTQKVIYPSSRYRGDFLKHATYWPDSSFVAPDGVTIIPVIYDLGRCASLSAAKPGETFYTANELPKKFYSFKVGSAGQLTEMKEIHDRGEYGYAVDNDGNLYIADGQIFVFDRSGKETGRINLEERPISLTFGGTDGNTLFITTNSALYGLKVK